MKVTEFPAVMGGEATPSTPADRDPTRERAGLRHAASFRDPAGFVFERDGRLFRQVNGVYARHFSHLHKSGLYDELVERGWLVEHTVVDERSVGAAEGDMVIEPVRLPFISHPYEWTFSMLQDAALLTLDIQLACLRHGMVLKDASAYNVQFWRGRPRFIDSLSFEIHEENHPWVAYRQFCQHFLAPLALIARCDHRLARLHALHRDGVPLDLASTLLPRRTRWSWGLGIHLHAHARSLRRTAQRDASAVENSAAAARISRKGLEALILSLRATIAGLSWRQGNSVWNQYYAQLTHYGKEGLQFKQQAVLQTLDRLPPGQVWDVGANTGQFSRLAAQRHPTVISWDFDALCVETLYREQKSVTDSRILPLVLDLGDPTPSLGWAQAERAGFLDRGPADTVLALGLMHHLVFGLQVPLPDVAALFRRIARRLIIEFVPMEDVQTRLLSSRIRGGGHVYDQAGFEQCFGAHFAIVQRQPVPETPRVLYTMEAR